VRGEQLAKVGALVVCATDGCGVPFVKRAHMHKFCSLCRARRERESLVHSVRVFAQRYDVPQSVIDELISYADAEAK
jgi:hypothetical protein